MIHFTCDVCGKPMFPGHSPRYEVSIEVRTSMDSLDVPADDLATDPLQDISDTLAKSEGEEEPFYRKIQYDLCTACKEKFLADPVTNAPKVHKRFKISEN